MLTRHRDFSIVQGAYLPLLSTLTILFCLRVLGQLLVAVFHVSFLPPMEQWYSGAIAYPALLACQIVIILLYAKVCLDFVRGSGYFFIPKRNLGSFLLQFGSLYLIVMLIRYIIRMGLYPAERWTGGSLPIFFHWVLAAFLLILGMYHRSHSQQQSTLGRDPKRTVWTRKHILIWISKALICATVLFWMGWQLLPSIVANQLGLRGPQYAVRVQRLVSMLTSDRIKLMAAIYHPQHIGKTPTILVRVPFSKSLKNSFYADLIGRIWAERGYTVVIQATRGRCESGGTFYPLRGERQDGTETLDWLSRQPWYNGQIASWGGSTFGYTQWAVADRTSPGLSALYIYEASTDFHGMFYPGGAFSLYSALSWAVNSRGHENLPSWPPPDKITHSATGLPLLDADRRATGQEIPFFRDWVRHYKQDSYWTEIDGIARNRSLKAPACLMAGWYDPFLPTQLNDFMQIHRFAKPSVARQTRLIVGPWAHASDVNFPNGTNAQHFRLESVADSLPWFDEVLQPAYSPHGKHEAPVRLFVMGKNEWRYEREWPLARTRYTAFYLHSHGIANGAAQADGSLDSIAPVTDDEPSDSYVYNPMNPVPTAGGAMIGRSDAIARQNEIEARPDVLIYTTPVLPNDIEITGPVAAIIYVTTSATSTDFTAKLIDVQADGSAYNVCDGILRSYGPTARRSQQLQTAAVREIKIDLWPTSMVFFKGHRLRLEVSSSNFPRFDCNPNTGNPVATEMAPVVAHQVVIHRLHYPSRLILPIIPEEADANSRSSIGAPIL